MPTVNQKVKKLKLRLTASVFLLFVLIVCGLFMLSGFSINRIVLALGNYSKGATDELTFNDWNNLDDDFVDASGDTMSGDLNMNSNKITNIPDIPFDAKDAVNQNYVDTAVATAGGSGGDVFINWGQQVCPGTTELLYRGYAFGNLHIHSGGAEAVCLQQPGDAGAEPGGIGPGANLGDLLYPLGTGEDFRMPPGIPDLKEIMCAVCFNPKGACYERWYGETCPGSSGFIPVYTGYGMGGYASHGPSQRHCVDNINFDGSVDNLSYGDLGDIWYGTVLYENADIGLYTKDSYVKCSMCCKQ